jgi:hypothetical protein
MIAEGGESGTAGHITKSAWQFLARSALILIGSAALAWAAMVAPVVWQQSRLDQMADRLMRGMAFNPERLRALVPDANAVEQRAFPSPKGLRSAALLRLALVEQDFGSGDRENMDADLAALDVAVIHALSQSPADAFLWLAAFWGRSLNGAGDDVHLAWLRMSYETGPREGWIAVRRNRIALALYPQLTPDLIGNVVHEFAGLVSSGLYDDAASILVGPGRPLRERLLESLTSVDYLDRERFAALLAREGYEVPVPGVEVAPQRPWR